MILPQNETCMNRGTGKKGGNSVELPSFFWRKRWDSNPRAREDYLISSQARYDHFDTLPYGTRGGALPGDDDSIAEGREKSKGKNDLFFSAPQPGVRGTGGSFAALG